MDDVWRWQKYHSVLELGGSPKFPIDLFKYAHTVNLWVCERIKLRDEGWRAGLKVIWITTFKKWILLEILWWLRPLSLELVILKRARDADCFQRLDSLLAFTDTFRRS